MNLTSLSVFPLVLVLLIVIGHAFESITSQRARARLRTMLAVEL